MFIDNAINRSFKNNPRKTKVGLLRNQPENVELGNIKYLPALCVISQTYSFKAGFRAFEALGVDVRITGKMDMALEILLEDPDIWSMFVIRLDRVFYLERLECIVQMVRLLNPKLPVVLISSDLTDQTCEQMATVYGDALIPDPKTEQCLHESIRIAQNANFGWRSQEHTNC